MSSEKEAYGFQAKK